jgi:hypothetical protein
MHSERDTVAILAKVEFVLDLIQLDDLLTALAVMLRTGT